MRQTTRRNNFVELARRLNGTRNLFRNSMPGLKFAIPRFEKFSLCFSVPLLSPVKLL
jgi:hypothetical protein